MIEELKAWKHNQNTARSNNNMNVYAFIPARGGSKGLRNKNILPIFGNDAYLLCDQGR